MIYELRKIAGNIPICIMFSAFVIINALIFFAYCTDDLNGYTMTQIQSKYRDIEGVKKQQEIMENSLRTEGSPDFDGVLLTRDIYSENANTSKNLASSFGYICVFSPVFKSYFQQKAIALSSIVSPLSDIKSLRTYITAELYATLKIVAK